MDHTEIFRGIVVKITYIEYDIFVWPELEMSDLYREIMGGAWNWKRHPAGALR
ncbi:MAG: hypothetical protein J4O01_11380 [Chloroflexi bacterium]|nr:hypothetical protein [Chloroflexota bacterium]MCH8115914.1 hypothetical protein [Chloroflexota bacterium]MCI0775862.1 hypothetical protein [Chloroflexota bacterium]MCI0804984.1 hypothetical protein [Chloroflexota bacterium]MCI0809620.1 hypothetical protein [Chloroflexota bacterium]